MLLFANHTLRKLCFLIYSMTLKIEQNLGFDYSKKQEGHAMLTEIDCIRNYLEKFKL